MSYSLTFTISLGTSMDGRTLNGQLFDSTGVNVGAAITTGFTEIGDGNYVLSATIPDDHRGGIKIYESGQTVILAVSAINPEDAEDVNTIVADVAGLDGVSPAGIYQQVSRETHRTSGVVYHVATNGNDSNDGLTWDTAKLSPKTVIEAATAGDTVIIGAGTFALGANYIQIPSGVVVLGRGIDITVLTSTYASSAYPVVSLGNNCRLSGLTVYGTLTGTSEQYAVGSKAAVAGFVVDHVKAKADRSAFYFYASSVSMSGEIVDSVGEGMYDAVTLGLATCDIRCTRCQFRSTGSSGISVGSAARGIASFRAGNLSLYDCHIRVNGGIYYNLGVDLDDCTVRMFGGGVRASGTGCKAVKNTNGTCVFVGVEYDRSLLEGTVTDVARVVTDTSGSAYGNLQTIKSQTVTATAGFSFDNLTTLIGKFTGVTLVASWLRGLFRKDAMDSTAKSEVNTGGGTFDETTDSNEAMVDTLATASALASVKSQTDKLHFTGNDVQAVTSNPATTKNVTTEQTNITVED